MRMNLTLSTVFSQSNPFQPHPLTTPVLERRENMRIGDFAGCARKIPYSSNHPFPYFRVTGHSGRFSKKA